MDSYVFDKISDAASLSPQEKDDFRNFGEGAIQASSLARSWVKPGTAKIDKSALLENPYQDATILDLEVDQPISNNTSEYLIFDYWNCLGSMFWRGAVPVGTGDNTIIEIPKLNCPYGFMGFVSWDTNGVGDRQAYIDFFDKNNSYLFTRLLHRAKPQGGGFYDVLPFSLGTYIYDASTSSPGIVSYCKIGVWQSSGGSLAVLQARLACFPMYTPPTRRSRLNLNPAEANARAGFFVVYLPEHLF